MSTVRRPDLHSLIHKNHANARKRPREEAKEEEDEIWNSDEETSDDESDYSVYSDEDDEDDLE